MNRVDNLRIRLPAQYAQHSEQISDQVREGISSRQWRGTGHIDQLDLGSIMTTEHTTADEIVNEILARIDMQMEPYR